MKEVIKEIVPVIIGILIALFINNWNEGRKDKKYLNQIFSSIENEFKESSIDIKRVIPKQLAPVDTIKKYLDNDKASLFNLMIKGGGIHSPTIKTNSWNN